MTPDYLLWFLLTIIDNSQKKIQEEKVQSEVKLGAKRITTSKYSLVQCVELIVSSRREYTQSKNSQFCRLSMLNKLSKL